MEFLTNKYFLLATTLVIYLLSQLLQKRLKYTFLNPLLITTLILIGLLLTLDIPYESYAEGGQYIEFWLKPAIVALGVPLYKQLETIKKQLVPILAAELVGCVVGIVSVVLIAQLLGASQEVVLSLVPKSVTTPIAMEVSSTIGGIPALTAAVVVCTGIFGGMAGFQMMSISRVKRPISQGLSMGTAAHAVGTSAAMTRSSRYGAFSSLGLTLNGLFTAILTPFILRLLGIAI